MALIKCSECGSEISDKAAACVKCGAPVAASKPAIAAAAKPKNKGLNALQLFGIALAGTFLLVLVVGPLSERSTSAAKADPPKPSCSATDLQCVAEANIVTASVYCKAPIERLAKHAVRWTDGSLELKVSRFRWTDEPGGTITFIGDKAEFQNGFGAYTPVIYFCELAPGTDKVLDVRVMEGRLPA